MGKNLVVFTVTGPHFQLTACALYSLLVHYESSQPLMVRIIATNVLNSDIQFMVKMPKVLGKPQVTVQLWAPPAQQNEIHDDFKARTGLPKMVIWRILVPYYFQDSDRILYLDNDLLVNTDVNELFDQLDPKYVLAAVKDFYYAALPDHDPRRDAACKRLRLPSVDAVGDYYNSGVIVFNAPRFRAENAIEDIISILNKTHVQLVDQTVLNQLTYGKTQFLPWRYNYQNQPDNIEYQGALDPTIKTSIQADYQHLKIRHFAGVPLSAPYEHIEATNPWEQEFWRVLLNVKRLSAIPEP